LNQGYFQQFLFCFIKKFDEKKTGQSSIFTNLFCPLFAVKTKCF